MSKGDEAGEYSVRVEDGKRYGLHGSNSVDPCKHLGHKVTVTGTKMYEENEEKEKNEAGGSGMMILQSNVTAERSSFRT